ncbi:MFS transporter [Pendulispora brunnea]|uniref:MFS transporter n=1 Tax=Pendulispora brunnea TaxID=2905690 RepID=A0ABZ2K3H7_9BACT
MAVEVRLSSKTGRYVLLATVLGSGMAMLDATVVNVTLPRIGAELSASMAGLQWIVNSYMLTLAAFILLGGSLGDRYGRRRLFVVGTAWFATASLLCGLAHSVTMLVAARVFQGIGGALLTPGSLALIQASIVKDDRSRAIGAWSALGGIAGAIGPFLGGWMADTIGWRWVFFLNAPLAVVAMAIAWRHVPESKADGARGPFDGGGALLGVLALAGITYALIEWSALAAVLGLVALIAFVAVERKHPDAMLPLDIFAPRTFAAINVVTIFMYAAISGVFFFLVLDLQVVAGFSSVHAGSALLPATLLLLTLSTHAGALAKRVGPRTPLAAGLFLAAIGVFLMSRIGSNVSYLADVLPAVLLFGVGLSLAVAPLTATVLASADPSRAGIASGVNNATARTGGLLAVAALPLLAGLPHDYTDHAAFMSGFRTAMLACAALFSFAGVLAWLLIRGNALDAGPKAPQCKVHCGLGAPPLEPVAD